MDGLIIKKQWLDLIFSGEKRWEIRGSKTHKRCVIGLIESGSGEVKGTIELVDCIHLANEEFLKNKDKHKVNSRISGYKKTYAWVLENPVRFETPKKYKHPQGAIIWVKI